MADEDVLWVPVLPSLRGFGSQLNQETRAAGERAGREAGDAFAGGLARAEGAVRKATDKLSAAQDKVADATGRRTVAQAKLNDLESSGRASSSQLAAATEAVERAHRGVEAAERSRATATRNLADANAAVTRSSQEAGDAVEVQGRRFHGFNGAISGAIGELKGFAVAAAGIGGALAVGSAAIEKEQIGSKLAASFGESKEEAKRYGDLAGQLYATGVGGSMDDVQAAIAATSGVFGSLDSTGSARIAQLTTKAQTLADVFGLDVAEGAETAANLVQNGLAKNADEAFDLMTRGMQEVSVSMRGELPEILQEYGTNFRALGFDGKESFNLLVGAAQQGKFALDKTGDSLKEFSIRGSDMSKASVAAYEALGINAVEASAKVAAGGDGAQEVLQDVSAKLLEIEDPADRANQAIALFGTPLEDLSVDQIPAFLSALAGTDDAMGDVAGATDAAGDVMYDNLGSKLELMKRGFQSTFVDLVGDDVLPLLGDFSGALEDNEGSALAAVAGMTGLGGVMTGFETAKATFDSVKDGVTGLRDGFLDAKDKAQQAWSAVSTGAGWVKSQATAAASFVKTSTSAAVNATKTAAAWTGAQLRAGAGWAAMQARAVGSFVVTAAAASVNAAATAGAWVASNIRTVASFVATRGAMLATTIATGAMTAAQWLLNVALNANPIGLIIGLLAAMAGAVYLAWQNSETFRNIVMGAWEGIKSAASFAWENVLKPVFGFFVAGLQQIGAGATWLWNVAIAPAFNGIGSVVGLVWEGVKVVFDWWTAGLRAIGDGASWLWNVAIAPAMDGIGAAVSFVWSNVVSPVFESMKTGVGLVGSAFEAAVGFIGRVWDGVKSVAAKPIKFVIDSVYNNGIRQAWNKVAGWLGLDELEEYKPDWLGAYASGGVLPGYTPGRDVHSFVSPTGGRLNLSGGEAVMRPEWTAAVGPAGVADMNRVARTRGTAGVREYMAEQNLALGGTVDSSLWEAVHTAFPGATLNSAYRPGDSGYHGRAGAIDVGGPMQQVADWVFKTFPDMAQLIWGPGPLLYNVGGNKISDQAQLRNQVYAGDLPGHFDHVHIGSDFPVTSDGQMVSDAGGSSGGGFWSMVTGFLRGRVADAFDAIVDPIGQAIPSFGDSAMGQLPRKAFDVVRGSVRDWLLGKADDKEGSAGPGGAPMPGTGPAVDQIKAAFAPYGWDTGDQWAAVDWIIGKESGWRADARNPSSGAFGYFQFNPSSGTLQEYLPDYNLNPGVQGAAGARYIRDRYGDPLAAKRFWEENGHYDQGGIASGVGAMLKNVIDPERVLDPAQTAAFEQLVPWLVDLGGMASGGFADIPGSAEFAGFLTQLPGQIFEETVGDTADFFGLGELSNAAFDLFSPDTSTTPAPAPPSGTDGEPPAAGAGGVGRGPLVVIEQMIVDNVQEAANAIGREARRAVRSEVLADGW